jgi:outer membrane biosynthesis protein TonB
VKNLLVLSLLAFPLLANAAARPAGLYYHEGATNFVYGDLARAKSVVAEGLQFFPENVKLKGLSEFLNKQQPPPSKQQDKQDQEKQDQSKQQEKQNQQNQQEQQKQNQQKQKQDQQQQQEQQQAKDQQEQQKRQQEKKDQEKQGESQQQKPEQGQKSDEQEKKDGEARQTRQQMLQMTPEQAQRLLEAVKGDEKVLIFMPQVRTNRSRGVIKDW